MFHFKFNGHHRSGSTRGATKNRQRFASSRLSLESLESRQMLSATTDITFQVVNDATANISYEYSATGALLGNSSLANANAAPRGVASMIGVDKTWVID